MQNVTPIIRLDNTMALAEATQRAEEEHLHLITDGREAMLSPIIPPGWHKLRVWVKPGPPAEIKAAA